MQRICLLMFLAVCCVFGSPAFAGDRVALVIGNGAYANMRKGPDPVPGAQAISTLLKSIGFKVTEGTDLTRQDMEALMLQFGTLTVGADIALVYYAGQAVGVGESEAAYLLPVDASAKPECDVKSGAVIDLHAVIGRILAPATTKLVFVDAPRPNPFQGRVTACNQAFQPPKTPPLENSFVVFAGAPEEQVYLGYRDEYSPFTKALLKNLAVPGAEITEIVREVRYSVAVETHKRQTPTGNNFLTSLLYLNPNPPPSPETK